MARHANKNWNLSGTEFGGRSAGVSDGHLSVAVLMDIRDELQKLNALLHCHNTVAIPALLRGIKRNTQPKVRAKAKLKKQ